MKAPIPEQTFDQVNFGKTFWSDCERSSVFACIESAYITVDGVKRFSNVLSNAVSRGVRTCVFVQEPADWKLRGEGSFDPARRAELRKTEAAIEYLSSLGVHVNVRTGTHLKLAVIDYKVTWGGTLNILSYTHRTDEEIWRWTDEEWARATIKRRRLEECATCKSTPRNNNSLTLESDCQKLGAQLLKMRRDAGLSQDELATSLGLCRQTLSAIETGKRFPKIESVFQIHALAQKSLVTVPADVVPLLEKWFEFYQRKE